MTVKFIFSFKYVSLISHTYTPLLIYPIRFGDISVQSSGGLASTDPH